MSPLLIKISKDFATLFTTINPIATLALFAGLTASLSRADRHWTALRADLSYQSRGAGSLYHRDQYSSRITTGHYVPQAALVSDGFSVAEVVGRTALLRLPIRLFSVKPG